MLGGDPSAMVEVDHLKNTVDRIICGSLVASLYLIPPFHFRQSRAAFVHGQNTPGAHWASFIDYLGASSPNGLVCLARLSARLKNDFKKAAELTPADTLGC